MESLVYTVDQVAELLQISTTSVYNLRNDGTLTQLPNISGVKFSKREVEALAGVEDEYNAIGYRKLQSEVESLRKENRKLKSEIKKITSQMLVIVGEDLND
ncbi:helix-turn-helix domain-containing protein [uncultured Veillonella sp.]|uniref:helix-turn-helix domain-containing protein n=1 Tax=uncultured Veillonella sp. TaxID=159268 RepID=UPI0025D28577|nr:helix-turn-helix domain-containing protein [uncultured Veillonella sp.]